MRTSSPDHISKDDVQTASKTACKDKTGEDGGSERISEATSDGASVVGGEGRSELSRGRTGGAVEYAFSRASEIVVAVQPTVSSPRKKVRISQGTYHDDFYDSSSTYDQSPQCRPAKSTLQRKLCDLRPVCTIDTPPSCQPPTKRRRMKQQPSPQKLEDRNPVPYGYEEENLRIEDVITTADNAELLDPSKYQPLADRAADFGVSERTMRLWDAEDIVSEDDEAPEGHGDRDAESLPIGLGGAIPPQCQNPGSADLQTQTQPIFARIQESVSRDHDMQTLFKALQRGWLDLIDKLLENKARIRAYSESDLKMVRYQIYCILIGMHSSILKSHMEGDLARQYLVDAETREEVDKLRERAKVSGQPAIYRQALVDEDG